MTKHDFVFTMGVVTKEVVLETGSGVRAILEVNRLIEKNRLEIWYKDDYGRKTVFYFRLDEFEHVVQDMVAEDKKPRFRLNHIVELEPLV